MNRIRFCRWVLFVSCASVSGCSVSPADSGGEDSIGTASQELRHGNHSQVWHRHRHHHHHGDRPWHCGDHPPGGSAEGVPIAIDDTGFVDGTSNSLGITGYWYSFSDGSAPDGETGSCQAAGHSDAECSLVTAPDPDAEGFPNSGGVMCTTGVVAQVLLGSSGDYDWSNMGFAGMGFNLNQPEDVPGVFDASASNVIGFAFEIDQVPAHFRVQVSTPDSPSSYYAYWGADEYYPDSPVVPGRNVVLFSDVRSPEVTPEPVDVTQLEGIQFVVPGNIDESVPFHYCLSNIEFLVAG